MKAKNGGGKSQLNGFLDAGSHLRGELHFDDTFRIEGRLTGKVDSDGDLYVGQGGEVQGEVRVGRLFVTARSTRRSRRNASRSPPAVQLRGEVSTPCLVIDEGAIFEGQARMVERERPAAATSAAARARRLSG
jgi:cytoskeletal protein CcmA (bactofilin family)